MNSDESKPGGEQVKMISDKPTEIKASRPKKTKSDYMPRRLKTVKKG